MNRKLLVTLLRKEIQELDMITEGFMEMDEYPKAIILLSQRKTEEIQTYIKQLSELKKEQIPTEKSLAPTNGLPEIEQIKTNTPADIAPTIDTNTEIEIQDEIESAIEFSTELIDFSEAAPEQTDETLEPTIQLPEKPEIIEEKPTIIADEKPITANASRNELLSKPDNTLGSILANKKITDIKQAINIGDRFRFQRELFKSNGEDMNKTLNYINQLATLDEVLSFLQSKYNWPAENEAVEDFLQIVRRRFL